MSDAACSDQHSMRAWLESQGFKFERNPVPTEFNEADWIAYRPSEMPARECEHNEGKNVLIVVAPYYFSFTGTPPVESFEVEVRGVAGKTWWKLRAYSLAPQKLRESLPDIERRLIAAWNALDPLP